MVLRRGGPDDAAGVIALFDEAVEWLVARGKTGQWGSEPLSRNAHDCSRSCRTLTDCRPESG